MAKFSQAFLQGLLQPSYQQGLFTAARGIGTAPQMRALQQQQQAKALEEEQKLARQRQYQANLLSLGASGDFDPEMLQGALGGATELGIDPSKVIQALSAGQTIREQQLKKAEALEKEQAFANRKKSLADTAKRLGLEGLANRIPTITSTEELRDVATEMRKAEYDKLPSLNPLQRKRLARASGVTDEEFDSLDLAKVSDDAFNSLISGQSGDLKPFLEGEDVKFFRVNEAGRVFDIETSQWKDAQELGLEQAPPQVQRVENITSGMAEELAEVGAKSFAEAHENARKAADALGSINRTLPTVDNMFTGAGAEVKLNIARYARTFGLDVVDPDKIEDTEAYIAESGRRVADYIRNLGAGTGLSNADREYAERVVAANVTVDREALKRLLTVLKKDAERKITRFNSLKQKVSEELGPQGSAALAFYGDVFISEPEPSPVRTGLSEQASSYFN